MPLIKLRVKSKEVEAAADAKSTSPPPPPYASTTPDQIDADNSLSPPDLAAGFRNLTLTDATDRDGLPQVAECIAHLKLLESFFRLRQRIGSTDGLFGVTNDPLLHSIDSLNISENEQSQLLAKYAEKRWAVYVTRAVDRFQKWYSKIMTEEPLTLDVLQSLAGSGEMLSAADQKPLSFTPDNLPPLDVLMVWHAYMLNPRAYLADQLRYGKQRLWLTKFPWQAINAALDSDTFSYNPSPSAENLFTTLTGEPWASESNPAAKVVECPQCRESVTLDWTGAPIGLQHYINDSKSWTSEELGGLVDNDLSLGEGYCDGSFSKKCQQCRGTISHDTLRAAKFRRDLHRLINGRVPMPGSILGVKGLPYKLHPSKLVDLSWAQISPFINDFFSLGLGQQILQKPPKDGSGQSETMDAIRSQIEDALKQKSYMRKVLKSARSTPRRIHNVAIRKLMSHYWENDSPFSLDLVGAVVRQGSFIEKMNNIDWLHSPALPNTMKRLIVKYTRFVRLMANPQNMAVPTLDVDLAWHTHQLAPLAYLQYTLGITTQFIDHDDKVAETKLNDAFEWTSKQYQRQYGEPYSECTCWYCEAVRESHTSSVSRLFSGGNARAQQQLHAVEQDPARSVHISAHNAVRPRDDPIYDVLARNKARLLEAEYQKACDRARGKGRNPPRRDDYYYSMAYGYPVYIPAYSPYVGYVGYNPGYYPCNPSCMATGAGAVGNCCSGTCGGGVAAGACAGGAGCAGGAAAGGGGACGGGGGGGCGGGGGGGGCGGGGGGGGGGCGGGGGGC